MATQPRVGYERAPGHVEGAFYAALTKRQHRVGPDTKPQPAPAPNVREAWTPPRPQRTRWRYWQRLLLRTLGVPYPLQNVLLDQHRWTVTVTRHAVESAGERYRDGNPAVIAAEVADAIANTRTGRRAPHRSQGAWGNARLAWTEDGSKTYVVRRTHRAWVVITALPAEDDRG